MPGGEISDHGDYTHNEGGSDELQPAGILIQRCPRSGVKAAKMRNIFPRF